MVDRVWVGGWAVDWIWVELWGRPSSGWRCWLCRLGGIIGIVFRLNPWWAPNSRGLSDPKHRGKDRRWKYVRGNRKCEGLRGAMNGVINALYPPPWGIPRGSIYRGS
jgi:hypothetical protein